MPNTKHTPGPWILKVEGLDANDIRVTVPGEDLSINHGEPCQKSTE